MQLQTAIQTASGISTHALREEGDAAAGGHSDGIRDFYPRPPRGGRPVGRSSETSGLSISTHALREEGDAGGALAGAQYNISTHALREEGDLWPARSCAVPPYFYPRPPRGGRPAPCFCPHVHMEFLPTPSARRATSQRCSSLLYCVFLPTPSARRATAEAAGKCPQP